MFGRVFAIFRKEICHILRDPFTFLMALVMPIIMVLMFGSAIEFNVQNIATAYVDQSKTPASRTFLNLLGSSKYFRLNELRSISGGIKSMESEQAKALIIIPSTFERDVLGNKSGKVQVLLDGTDSTAIGAISGYIGAVQGRAISEICGAPSSQPPVQLVTRFMFNPELNSQWFTIPGLAAVVMAILSIMLTALTISREWENGSMELLLSTPVRPMEIVGGKILPYGALGLLSLLFLYIVARMLYGLPFVGSHLVFLLGSVLFLVAYLGLGLLVSTIVSNQQAAVQMALMIGMMPAMLFSGFIFALEHMPAGFRVFASIFPARWYVQIARDQFLKGSAFLELKQPFAALFASAFVVMCLCVFKFKKTLEK
ncbi:MAG: ABC transporter permease [Holosporales bacterium]|jgi:ABC-2 type transport system permease protein|nr:ABC transporter permease [Holosporales bacterium]